MGTPSTIFALSSAPGRAAVAVIRVSGPAARDVLARMAGGVPEPRRAALRVLRHPETGDRLDQALVLFFAAPSSETGEDLAELQVHGGRAVIAAVLAALAAVPGCRMAEPGEFARRAFDNGKLDLTAADGLADLIDAETEGQRRQALLQASGGLGRLYEGWRERLIAACALVEAAIDFSDEADVSDRAVGNAEAIARSLVADIACHLDDGHRGEILREGFRVVLAGPPNAGKSSLLNALARRDVAIVSAEAGTTRDVIEVRLDLGGLPVIVTDTAGIREAGGAIEAEGIRRTLTHARAADLVLWLTDAAGAATAPPADLAAHVVPVLTKIDLLSAPSPQPPAPPRKGAGGSTAAGSTTIASCATGPTRSEPAPKRLLPPCGGGTGSGSHCEAIGTTIAVSAVTGDGLGELTRRVHAVARERLGTHDRDGPVITQARHRQQLERAIAALHAFLANAPPDLELRAEELRRAVAALGRITGRIDVEDVLDQVFGRFCIGK